MIRRPDRRPAPDGSQTMRFFSLLGGCLLFGYPILGLVSRSASLAGIPVLYVYLFVVWALFIALIAWLVEGRRNRR